MKQTLFSSLPPQAFMTLGGFTAVRTEEWRRYLAAYLRRRPHLWLQRAVRSSRRWHENDCVFVSLSQYLLAEFGLLAPEDSLFQFFNPHGAGIGPQDMVAAISAVVEPLGLTIDRILAPDPELRAGLGDPERTVGLEQAGAFAGQAGVCMINVKEGCSHAFFWDKMDPARFHSEKFRLAVLLKRQAVTVPAGAAQPTAVGCFEEFRRLLENPAFQAGSRLTPRTSQQLERLAALVATAAAQPDGRGQVDQGLQTFLAALPAGPAFAALQEAGQLVRRVFRDCTPHQLAVAPVRSNPW